MTAIAPVTIYPGHPFAHSFEWRDANDDLVSLTGWTGEATFAPMAGDSIVTVDCTLTDPGVIAVALTADETDLFPALARAGAWPVARMQVVLTDGADTQVFEAAVNVTGILEAAT